MEEVPVIIHHTGGNQEYFQSCVRINSQKNKVYLIGEHVHINELDSNEISEFKEHFVNYGSNGHVFELNCFLRVFYLKQLIMLKQLTRVFYVDSDCVVLDNISEILHKCPDIKIGYSIQTFTHESDPFPMGGGCIHNSVINMDFCNKYIELCFDIYKTKTKFHLIEPTINHHKNGGIGVSDMTIGYLCYLHNIFSDPITDLIKIITIDGEECTFDHNVYEQYGHLGPKTYQVAWNTSISRWCEVKTIHKVNNKYYATTIDNKRIRLLSIHFQGGAKDGLARFENINWL
jgi:hypothetical protein